MTRYDVIIIGGGAAGLAAALSFKKTSHQILVIEKHPYPKHKVCGEYVSNEVLPLLDYFEIDVFGAGAITINGLNLSLKSGKRFLSAPLPLGGFGISRYTLDFALFQKAKHNGVDFVYDTVTDVCYDHNKFTVSCGLKTFEGKIVIGAYGKRSNLDKAFNRNFIAKKSEWIGIKAHYRYPNMNPNLVSLHHFDRGYAGISMIEDNKVNCCYLCSTKNFKSAKNVEVFQKEVAEQNPFLKSFFQDAEMIFEKPMTIAQISFAKKELVHHHMLFCGDAAGLIHPLCGNGIAMALHSGAILAHCVIQFLENKGQSQSDLEKNYCQIWNQLFSTRLYAGRKLQKLLLQPNLNKVVFATLKSFPGLLGTIIKSTHGKPIFIK